MVVFLLWAVVTLFFYAWSLTFDLKTISDMPQRSSVYDKDGKYYSRLAGENRIVVPFDKVSNDFVNALLAREDTRFYYHHGIDPIGIARAVVRNFIAGGFREGASTLTQQLARNSFPLGGKNLIRKMVEAALAHRIETELTKEQILEAYMNRIYFGSGYYGVETASRAYFGKPASQINLPESAMLAGLIRSPNRFSPFNNIKKAVRERNAVLARMRKLGFITEEQMVAAMASAPKIGTKPKASPQDNWAMDSILRELELVIDRDQFDNGGLRIYTTIDGPLQNIAEASLRKRLQQIESLPGFPHKPMRAYRPEDSEDGAPYLEGAAIAIDSRTGGIRAIAGGRDYARSKFNRAVLGRRQVGSAVKPFVYAKAFENGLRPGDLVDDSRLHPGELPPAYGRYDPANSDNTYRGELPASEGLVLSRNTMSVRIGIWTGLDTIRETIVRSGLSRNPPLLPSLCLGAFESTLKDLTASYTTFANGGVRLQPYLIERIDDPDGQTIYKATHGKLPVVKPEATRTTVSLMQDVLTRGTGARAKQLGLRHSAAGKTGTTNDYQDAWFIGFDDQLVCGAWVGFDQPKKIMTGGTGGELALPIWVDMIEAKRAAK
ncbi:MAG TPA: PBP1A family penicillin-binding protein [Terrimicrobiaceae bacterium]|nr:PBP1A family penicillin-binding protein [Terrimicrobiaceae bacterium]